MNVKKILTLFVAIIILLFSTFCSDHTITTPNDPPTNNKKYDNLVFSDKVEIFKSADFASEFKFSITLNDTSLKVKQIKIDFNDNNEYDTTLTTMDTVITSFTNLGYNNVIASVVLEDNSVLSCSTTVWFTVPQVILNDGWASSEPNIYNGKYLSITHGYGHQVVLLDLTNFAADYLFSNFESYSFQEMHISIPSFDGTKLIFDNGGYIDGVGYKFGYSDLTNMDSTINVLPMHLPGYAVGQLIWSLDSKSVYYIDGEIDYSNGRGVKKYELETGEHTNIYDYGQYLCVVPGFNDKLAILEKIDESTSKLLIINTASRTVENEFTDIPFHAPFRMLEDGDRVYFDGELSIYRLSTGEIYKMDFPELDLSDHMYGEADISMDGGTFILSLFKEPYALYKIILPVNY